MPEQSKKTTEEDLAMCIVDWKRSEGFTTYEEVAHEGPIADIVGVRGPDLWITECKLCRSAALIQQAKKWIGQATCVWVATRKTTRLPPKWWIEDCRFYGLGVFTVDDHGEVKIRLSPVRHRMTDLGIRASLNEAQKDFAQAGNATNSRWSPFQQLARALRAAVDTNPGVKLSDFAADFDHHYSSDEAAVAWIQRIVKSGGIKGLVVRHGKVFEEDFDRHSMTRKRKV